MHIYYGYMQKFPFTHKKVFVISTILFKFALYYLETINQKQ